MDLKELAPSFSKQEHTYSTNTTPFEMDTMSSMTRKFTPLHLHTTADTSFKTRETQRLKSEKEEQLPALHQQFSDSTQTLTHLKVTSSTPKSLNCWKKNLTYLQHKYTRHQATNLTQPNKPDQHPPKKAMLVSLNYRRGCLQSPLHQPN